MQEASARAVVPTPRSGSPIVLVAGAETGGRFAVIEARERRDTAQPRHIHTREDEIVYVLAGQVLFEIAGEHRTAPAGACIFLPRDSEHSYRVESDEALLLIFVAPAGLEAYYCELHQSAVAQGGQNDIEWLVTLAARFGLTITGPGA